MVARAQRLPALQRELSLFMRRGLAFWLATGLGSGLARKAPGTFGSAAAVLPWLLIRDLPAAGYLAVVALTFAVGVWAAQRVIDQIATEDPGLVVIDEWVGLWLTLFVLPAGWIWVLGGFLAFRAFDILKPWPIGWADRKLKGGMGTMVDDALAGVMAFLLMQLISWGLGTWG